MRKTGRSGSKAGNVSQQGGKFSPYAKTKAAPAKGRRNNEARARGARIEKVEKTAAKVSPFSSPLPSGLPPRSRTGKLKLTNAVITDEKTGKPKLPNAKSTDRRTSQAKPGQAKPGGPRGGGPINPRSKQALDAKGKPPAEGNPKHDLVADHRGKFFATTRPFSEQDAIDEVTMKTGADRKIAQGESWVLFSAVPVYSDESFALTFARQGFPVEKDFELKSEINASELGRILMDLLPAEGPWSLSWFVPDADSTNTLGPMLDSAMEAVLETLSEEQLARKRELTGATRYEESHPHVQIAMVSIRKGYAGVVQSHRLLSRWAGGRARMRVTSDRPSRAARKVEEALAWMGMSPSAGEVCVDLGAAPGGWTWALAQKKCKVIAIDPAQLRPDVKEHRLVKHVCASAFQYEPDDAVDWLFGDMAWRPLEVAQLVQKWGRNNWTRLVVSNFKLPMKKKAEIVLRIEETVRQGGFSYVRTRQLYHDRDEITLIARK